MATNYPGALDTTATLKTDILPGDSQAVEDHAALHNDANAAVLAVQAELGTDPSGAAATVKARFEAIEANDWVTAARIAANAVGSSEIQDGSVTAAKIGALTTKGDLLSRDGSGAVRLPVGTDGQVLVASSAATAGVVWANGSVQARTTSGAITLLDTVVTADTTSGAVTLTLPAASGCTGKAIRIIKTAGANTLTVARAGSDTITPSSGTRTSVAFPSDCAMGEIVLVSSGTAWHVVSGQASDESVGSRLYKWSQATAAGSTTAAVGWQVVRYDSGLRDVSALLSAAHLALNPNAKMTVRRVNWGVMMTYYTGTSNTATGAQSLTTSAALPTGFQWTKVASNRSPVGPLINSVTALPAGGALYFAAAAVIVCSGQAAGTQMQGGLDWLTSDNLPTSLPGSAA